MRLAHGSKDRARVRLAGSIQSAPWVLGQIAHPLTGKVIPALCEHREYAHGARGRISVILQGKPGLGFVGRCGSSFGGRESACKI